MTTLSPTYGAFALAEAVRTAYRAGQTDYAIEPLVAAGPNGAAIGRIDDGDAVVFCCRRGEREIQLTEAFTEPGFDRFPRPLLRNLTFVPLTLYHEKFKDLPVAFAPTQLPDTLGEIVGRAGLRQLRVAESEKYAHVTFFLNGGVSQPFPGEEDVCIPSPVGVPYESVPELSLARVAGEVAGRPGAGLRPDRHQLRQRRCDRPYEQPRGQAGVRRGRLGAAGTGGGRCACRGCRRADHR